MEGEPTYWYSADLVTKGPGSVIDGLIKITHERVIPQPDLQTGQNLHCKMFYNYYKGRDLNYEEEFFKEPQMKLRLTNFYWDKDGRAGAAVQLDRQSKRLYRSDTVPHVSCVKLEKFSWRDIAIFVTKAEESNAPWEPCDEGIEYSPQLRTYCTKLNWSTTGVKAVHLSGQTVLAIHE